MREPYPKMPIAGVGAVIIEKDRILLEKRKNEPGQGKWSIPGGKVELGESTEAAVVREVKEETGLDVDHPRLIDVVSNVICDEAGKVKYHFVIIDYFVKIRGGRLHASSDAAELRWVGLFEVDNYNLTDSFAEFFKKNFSRLKTLESSQQAPYNHS